MKRIGVMGCGHVADFGHLPAIKETAGLTLAAVFDPDRNRAEAAASKFETFGASELTAFLEQDLDAVVVASPAGFHRDNVLWAAAHGLDVLCEKPIADSPDHADEMVAAMAQAGRRMAIGFVYRYSPVAQQIRSWVREGVIGEIRALRLMYVWDLHGRYEPLPDGTWVESPRWRGRMEEGGPLVDCGVHQIDLARWWLGEEVERWTAAGAWVANYPSPDHVWLHLDHEGGAHSAIETSFTYGHTARDAAPIFSYDLIGTGGFIRYDRDGWRLQAHTGDGICHGQGASEKNFAGMYAAWQHALESGDWSEMPTARDARIATDLALAATAQIRQNRASVGPLTPQI